MYDLIIIGAGPAGITASVYAARKKIRFLTISENIGGQTIYSADVENYTGFQFITGPELAHKFRQHMEQFRKETELLEGESVISLEKDGSVIKVTTNSNIYETKTAIIASGRIPKKLNVEGEETFRNIGVAYCATCDGPLFSGKDVGIVGGGNSALDATLQLMKIANKIFLIDTADKLKADPVMVEKAKSSDKVTILNKTSVEKIYGDKFVKGITISSEGKRKDIPLQGIFIEIGSTAASGFAKDFLKDSSGEIMVNCKNETSLEGVFAAGDVTNIPAKQIIVACGEGAKATLSAFEYINKLDK